MTKTGMDASGPPPVHSWMAPRPALFRALGRLWPPLAIDLGGRCCRRVAMLKYDSWAATAVYDDDQGERVACKFNRVHPLGFIPMRWLGRALARREQKVLIWMQDVEGFPRWAGPVTVDGKPWASAVAHAWIECRPFNPWARVDDRFSPRLRDMVAALHRHDIAYVDMSKWDNILVGDDGKPYLIDYQVHFQLPGGWPWRWLLRRLLQSLQIADRFYLCRHWSRVRPDQLTPEDWSLVRRGPWFIRGAEAMGAPWRFICRSILRLAGVRTDDRRASIPVPPPWSKGNVRAPGTVVDVPRPGSGLSGGREYTEGAGWPPLE